MGYTHINYNLKLMKSFFNNADLLTFMVDLEISQFLLIKFLCTHITNYIFISLDIHTYIANSPQYCRNESDYTHISSLGTYDTIEK